MMQLEPKDLYEKLEFDKVLELVSKECLSEMAHTRIHNLPIDTERSPIYRKLIETHEYKTTIEEKENFPIGIFQDLTDDLKMLDIIDSVLSIEGLQRINLVLLSFRRIFKFFKATRIEAYPNLYSLIRPIVFDETLSKHIDQIIDENGEIRANASPELSKIRSKIFAKQRELEKRFKSLISQYRKNGWLTDNVESFRNGRRVLSVPSEHKRKIRGIIHDESTTGKTAFIEPEPIIEINNDIFDLETEERREIYRLLKELSTVLRPYSPLLATYQEVLIDYDVIQAKANFAYRLNAQMPKIKNGPSLGLKQAFHPLLYLKNKEINKKTVPFDLFLLNENRILMLSGPNAGGKSITMKSLGLIQLMFQAGMLIPAEEDSEMGIFKSIFADIGDQQSIEDDLSTYSSRLKNMQVFLAKATSDTMVLIDEFGSGTDPKIGGAIAEAILKELNHRKVQGLITTHYSNLKMFAFKTRGIVNGSMTFDKDSLSPSYELKVGRPGSSYAYEIAEKSGLPKKVLSYAKHKTGKNEKAVDELLVDLQRERQELSEALEDMEKREKKLEHLIKTYDRMNRDFEYKRKKLKLEAKEQALQSIAQENKEYENLIRKIKEEKNLEKAKAVAKSVKEKRAKLGSDVDSLREEIYYKQDTKTAVAKEIKVGDFVRLKTGGATGTVQSIKKNKVIVLMGIMTMTADLRDLQHANEPLDIKTEKGIKTNMVTSSATFESKIDLRGLRREEALKVLETFVDKALMSSVTTLRIIHGKGDGILRKGVKSKLREYKAIREVRHPESNDGGDGVTIVEF